MTAGIFRSSFSLSIPTGSSIYQGMSGIAKYVVQEVIALPPDILSMTAWVVTLSLDLKPLTLAMTIGYAVWNSVALFQQAGSLKSGKMDTVLKLALYAMIIPQVMAIPDATIEGIGQCHGSLNETVTKALNCFRDGNPIVECIKGLDLRFNNRIILITRHTANVTSFINTDARSNAFCFVTSLDLNSTLARTCFDDINTMWPRRVFEVTVNMPKLHYNNLQPLQSRFTVIVEKGPLLQVPCGSNTLGAPDYNLGEAQDCFLTVLHEGEKIAQTCFNRKNPFAHTLKPIEGISIDYSSNQPISFAVTNVEDFKLNPFPEPPTKEEL